MLTGMPRAVTALLYRDSGFGFLVGEGSLIEPYRRKSKVISRPNPVLIVAGPRNAPEFQNIPRLNHVNVVCTICGRFACNRLRALLLLCQFRWGVRKG